MTIYMYIYNTCMFRIHSRFGLLCSRLTILLLLLFVLVVAVVVLDGAFPTAITTAAVIAATSEVPLVHKGDEAHARVRGYSSIGTSRGGGIGTSNTRSSGIRLRGFRCISSSSSGSSGGGAGSNSSSTGTGVVSLLAQHQHDSGAVRCLHILHICIHNIFTPYQYAPYTYSILIHIYIMHIYMHI